VHYYDLEDPDDINAFENPKLVLEHLKGLIVIDEIQLRPNLFPYLRVLVDRNKDVKLLVLGSTSQELIHQSSESLAGRISYIEVTPFSIKESDLGRPLWVRGGYPNSLLAVDELTSFGWRQSYIRTFLEKDIPSFGFLINAQLIRRFWTMLCDYHGNIFNASELGRALDLDHKTTKRYLDILTGTFMVRQLQPWFANISKRQVKSTKIYFRDSGIYHALLNIPNDDALTTSSKVGASWEGFALEQVIRLTKSEPQDCFFWSTQSGAEIDLLIVKGMEKKGFEFKYSNKPAVTKSMHVAMETLGLDDLTIIIPGSAHYFLTERIEVWGLQSYANKI
jgi:predicted AAA+ superfamily ATPase